MNVDICVPNALIVGTYLCDSSLSLQGDVRRLSHFGATVESDGFAQVRGLVTKNSRNREFLRMQSDV
jgi:hypothetical protein